MRGQDTKQRIIDAALSLGSERGMANVSLGDIAEEVGITKATIFSHYASREDLILASLRHGASLLREEEVSLDGSAEEVLGRAVSHWTTSFTTRPVIFYIRIIEQAKYYDAEARKRSEAFKHMIQAQSFVVLEALSDSGRLEIADLDLAATLFSSSIRLFIMDEVLSESDEDDWMIDRLIRRFCELFAKKES